MHSKEREKMTIDFYIHLKRYKYSQLTKYHVITVDD